MPSLTNAFVTRLHALSAAALSPANRALAKSAILDCLACAVAGSREPASHIVSDEIRAARERPESTVIGQAYSASAASAALINGVAAHALDYDDISPLHIHPSVALVPALLAVGERIHATGTQFLDAYLTGFEAQVRLCRAMNPVHYAAGWHPIGTVGALGAAIGTARLLGYDDDQMRQVLGVAASSAGGLRQNFGTMTKPLHAGHAASAGVRSAELVGRGFTADPDILDGPRGFFAVLGANEQDAKARLDALTGAQLEIERSGLIMKRYACCGAIPASIDALRSIIDDNQLNASDIRTIECSRVPMANDVLIYSVATNKQQAMFCQEYCLAVAAFDGQMGPAQVARVTQSDVQDLMRRVSVSVDRDLAALPGSYFPARVSIHMNDGRSFTTLREAPRGHTSAPLSPEEINRKVRDCCLGVLTTEQTDDFLKAMANLEQLDDIAGLAGLSR